MQRLRRGNPDSGLMVKLDLRIQTPEALFMSTSMVALSVFVPLAKASCFFFLFFF